MEDKNISFKKFLPGFAWFFLVGVLTLMPGKEIPELSGISIPHLDKLVHVVLFGGLTLFFCLPYVKTSLPFQKKRNLFIRISLSIILWGLIIEVIQKYFIPDRGFEWLDVVADTVGVLIAYWICLKLVKSKTLRDKIPFF